VYLLPLQRPAPFPQRCFPESAWERWCTRYQGKGERVRAIDTCTSIDSIHTNDKQSTDPHMFTYMAPTIAGACRIVCVHVHKNLPSQHKTCRHNRGTSRSAWVLIRSNLVLMFLRKSCRGRSTCPFPQKRSQAPVVCMFSLEQHLSPPLLICCGYIPGMVSGIVASTLGSEQSVEVLTNRCR